MKDLGTPSTFIELEILRRKGVLFIHQRKMVIKILKRFEMENCKAVSTPMITYDAEKKSVGVTSKIPERCTEFPFREIIGSLLYLANGSRPDIFYAVNFLSRRQTNFSEDEIIKVKRVLRYLRGTINLGLKYESKENELECYADASLGTNDCEGRSTSGIIVKLFGDVLFWRTKRQTYVAMSTAEAEFIAMSQACKELVCIKELCLRLAHLMLTAILYEDNQAAIRMAKSDDPQSLKHIVKLCYHYVRLEVSKRNMIIKYVGTKQQLADALTKALGNSKFLEFRNQVLCIVPE